MYFGSWGEKRTWFELFLSLFFRLFVCLLVNSWNIVIKKKKKIWVMIDMYTVFISQSYIPTTLPPPRAFLVGIGLLNPRLAPNKNMLIQQ